MIDLENNKVDKFKMDYYFLRKINFILTFFP